MVDMEQMFSLLNVNAEVEDKPGAPALVASGGEVRFENVRFGYRPDREILHGVSFTIPAGKRLAIVPHGALFYLPFAALPDPDGGQPLVVNHELISLPSATTLAVLRANDGCTDTNANASDFATGTPQPRHSGSALKTCSGGSTGGGTGGGTGSDSQSVTIPQIQGNGATSPLVGKKVSTRGVVTKLLNNGSAFVRDLINQ